jgi:SAM-dependent methyltransferase
MCSGIGLHSKLLFPKPIFSVASTSAQAVLVLKEIGHTHAKKVLEIGCGQGFCTIFLATLCPNVFFHGIDIVPRHIDIATRYKESGAFTNTEFSLCDATRFDNLPPNRFDLIFSVEALCHLDTSHKRHDFLTHAYNRLGRRGRIVIIDGFRSLNFDKSSANQQTAMCLAEAGFRIRKMPTKNEWIDLARDLNFELIEDRDLTREVLPFWRLGWRMARFILKFSYFLKYMKRFNMGMEQTTGNFISIVTTAHAFRDRGTAEYGMIILQKKFT